MNKKSRFIVKIELIIILTLVLISVFGIGILILFGQQCEICNRLFFINKIVLIVFISLCLFYIYKLSLVNTKEEIFLFKHKYNILKIGIYSLFLLVFSTQILSYNFNKISSATETDKTIKYFNHTKIINQIDTTATNKKIIIQLQHHYNRDKTQPIVLNNYLKQNNLDSIFLNIDYKMFEKLNDNIEANNKLYETLIESNELIKKLIIDDINKETIINNQFIRKDKSKIKYK